MSLGYSMNFVNLEIAAEIAQRNVQTRCKLGFNAGATFVQLARDAPKFEVGRESWRLSRARLWSSRFFYKPHFQNRSHNQRSASLLLEGAYVVRCKTERLTILHDSGH